MQPFTHIVYKDEGTSIIDRRYSHHREGVVVVQLLAIDKIYSQFPDPENLENAVNIIDSVSLYVDGRKLHIGHISFHEFDRIYAYVTIQNPFLMPGNHIGELIILFPSGETFEYEWQFEVVWW